MTQNVKPILYRIRPSRPEAHIFEVELTVREPNASGQRFSLPAWIPGSYMIREFARNIVTIRARCGDDPVALKKIDKHTWQAAPCAGPITLSYEVYAWDLSVRGAHFDANHAFFNGTSVFLAVQGQEASPCVVTIERPTGTAYRNWRIATALPVAGAKPYGFGKYRAENYDELIDHPVEMGTFSLVTFRARGVPHDVAITGRHDADLDRIARDLKRICEHQIDLFGGKAPMQRYVFLIMAVGDGYGGLEHRASTALLCSRWDLPRSNVETQDDRYLTFLGLASHEYFHTWNVKRIKPAAFAPYDLTQENYTRLLWAFEGITSYYDDLTLVRCGLMTEVQYLKALARTMTTVQRGSGRLKQTVAESSFDAWVKYYRQDENAPNAVVSYYAKGALIALALDLTLRKATSGKRSLDDVMQALWNEYGRTGRGVGEDEIEALAQRVTGVSLQRFFDRMLRSTRDIDWGPLLRTVGVGFRIDAATSNADRGGVGPRHPPSLAVSRAVLGGRVDTGSGEVKLGQVYDGGAAQSAGLTAGDVLIAVEGIRCTASNWELLLGRHRPGDAIRVTGFRRDELFECEVVLQSPPADTFALWLETPGRPSQRRARSQWLAG